MSKKSKYIISLATGLFSAATLPLYAAGPRQTYTLNSPLAFGMILIMGCLLFIIGMVAGRLVKAARFQTRSSKRVTTERKAAVLVTGLVLLAASAFGQDTGTPEKIGKMIGGMSAGTFYTLATGIF